MSAADTAMDRAVEAAAQVLLTATPARVDQITPVVRLAARDDAQAVLSAALRVLAQHPATRGLRAEDLFAEFEGAS